MSTVSDTTSSDARTEPAAPSAWLTLWRSTVSEVVKLRSLPSSCWLLATGTASTLLLGPVQAVGELVDGTDGEVVDSAGAVSLALTGATTAALVLGVLGVLVVTGEYVPRAVRTTFMLVPRRPYVVVGKALAVGGLTALLSLPAVAAAVTVSFGILAHADLRVGWGSPDVLRVSAGVVWYLVGWAVLGLATGWLTRSKLGGAALLLGVMLVLGPVLALVPGRTGEVLTGLLPSSAGGAMLSTHHSTALEAPAVGFVLWTGYLVVSVALSAWVVSRRDA